MKDVLLKIHIIFVHEIHEKNGAEAQLLFS